MFFSSPVSGHNVRPSQCEIRAVIIGMISLFPILQDLEDFETVSDFEILSEFNNHKDYNQEKPPKPKQR